MYLQDFIVQHLMLETYNLKFSEPRESSKKTKRYIKVFLFFFIVAKGNFFHSNGLEGLNWSEAND